jgi:signal transduction histidine kinase
MIIDAFHRFFFFLSTTEGILLKRIIELIFFTLITYMIVSEFMRTHEKELRYLSIAFAALAFQKFLLSAVFAYEIFGNVSLVVLKPFLPVLEQVLESLAILFLSNAFIFAIFKKIANKSQMFFFRIELIIWAIISIAGEIGWRFYINANPGAEFFDFKGYSVFLIFNIFFLLVPIIYWLSYRKKDIKYRGNIILAFSVYLITWLIRLVNLMFYGGDSPRLLVAEQPFPILSALLFTQIIYLKLVDKATLKEKLRISEQKYETEKRLSKMKDEFVSVVSHELKTPLTSMKLYISLLKDGKFGQTSNEQIKALEVMDEESNRLNFLIDDILNLSRLESGKARLRLENINLYELVQQNNMHYRVAEDKGLKVITLVPKKFYVNVDPDKFKQVFINLLSNAIKYTNKGSITIIAKKSEKYWELNIKDTGMGIEKKYIPKLFDKFYQVEDYMTRTQSGSGLGLAIVKKIVELHKGKIKVESKMGKGSTFTVIIPYQIKV